MAFETAAIVKALAGVTEPRSGKDIITLNMVRDLQVDDGQVNFTLELPALDTAGKAELHMACVKAVRDLYPEAEVNVHMMARAGQAGQAPESATQIRNVIAVASGKGGVGKSTVAANLALGLKQLGAKVGLLDADLYGPSMPTMFGLQGQRPKVREINGQPKLLPLEAHGLPIMSIGFIVEPEQAVVLRGPRLAGIIKQFFNDCVWPPLDYLVVDLPPGTGDIQLTLVQTVPVTGAVIVTTPQEVAVADAIKATNMFRMPSVNVPILGVVENMAWFTPKELPENKYFLFGEGGGKRLAKFSESMLLGQVPLIQGIRESGDAGRPAILNKEEPALGEAFLLVAKNTARQVAVRNEMLDPTRVVKIQNQ